jgi:hypothetical protein
VARTQSPKVRTATDSKCKLTFGVQWITPDGKRAEGMLIMQLKWWDDEGRKKFPSVCYNEGTRPADWIIVMADSTAGFTYLTNVPVTTYGSARATTVTSTGQVASTSVLSSSTTYVPTTTTTTWQKVAYSIFYDGERQRTDEVSGFWMMRYNTGPYRKAMEKSLEWIEKNAK